MSPTHQDESPDRDEPVPGATVPAQEQPDEASGTPAEAAGPTSYRMRRAPRYGAFGFTGVALGVIVGLFLATAYDATGDYSMRSILGYFVAIFGLLGALLGCGVAVLFERRKN